MIKVKNLIKHFGKFKALDELNLYVKKGSVYGLVGPSGAGKTTLIKHLMGVYRQDSGTITINSEPIFENSKIKASMAYIPDDLFYFSQYNIDETAKFYSNIYSTWNWERYETLKKAFPIDTKRRVSRLSKGMQKQVAFWLGICIMPQIMILDEPVDGLDPVMRRKVWNLILQDVAEKQTTVLVSSHNLRELEDVCDHIGILNNGRIVVEHELDNLKSNIHKLQLAYRENIPDELLQNQNILHKMQSGSVLQIIIRGEMDKLKYWIQKTNPIVLDILPLTLEEIFIYELGGMGYEIENIII